MRAVLVVSLAALLAPAVANAQSPTSPPAPATAPAPALSSAPAAPRAAPGKSGDLTKAQYVERAVERARRAAETRFDRMDSNHDGVLSAEERRAARAQKSGAPSQ